MFYLLANKKKHFQFCEQKYRPRLNGNMGRLDRSATAATQKTSVKQSPRCGDTGDPYALVTPLVMQVSMGGDDLLVSRDTYARLPLLKRPIAPFSQNRNFHRNNHIAYHQAPYSIKENKILNMVQALE